ncbi:MAG: hypothetical protein QF364_00935 [Candidatus Poseidoniaceae archaeon]|jgi:hypothetical protein|nr:hypothetical protein [Candidatus Poseidoniaceae archaeon]
MVQGMGPWDTVVEEIEEEVDMFAELGALRPAQTVANVSAPVTQQDTYDPLAAFMDEDEESLVADSLFALNEGTNVVHENQVPEPSTPLSNEVITELLEVLVKKELHARAERGENWLGGLPADAQAKIDSARVIKEQQAYHLSLIIDMVGTGEVRPFATVLSTNDGALPVSPPSHLSKTWYPLYNALRELLLQAMDSLSKLNVISGKVTA